jgi:hypothetical protein
MVRWILFVEEKVQNFSKRIYIFVPFDPTLSCLSSLLMTKTAYLVISSLFGFLARLVCAALLDVEFIVISLWLLDYTLSAEFFSGLGDLF